MRSKNHMVQTDRDIGFADYILTFVRDIYISQKPLLLLCLAAAAYKTNHT